MIKRFNLNKTSHIVEIASNDGYLLKFFVEHDIPVLGIEPASNVAKSAIKKGIPTLEKFFNTDTAEELKEKNQKADVLLGNNVLAHVPDVNNFIQGMKILLKPNGVITMEFPHILQLLTQNQFDTIYHEHLSYLSLKPLMQFFSKNGFEVIGVEVVDIHADHSV